MMIKSVSTRCGKNRHRWSDVCWRSVPHEARQVVQAWTCPTIAVQYDVRGVGVQTQRAKIECERRPQLLHTPMGAAAALSAPAVVFPSSSNVANQNPPHLTSSNPLASISCHSPLPLILLNFAWNHKDKCSVCLAPLCIFPVFSLPRATSITPLPRGQQLCLLSADERLAVAT